MDYTKNERNLMLAAKKLSEAIRNGDNGNEFEFALTAVMVGCVSLADEKNIDIGRNVDLFFEAEMKTKLFLGTSLFD